MIVQLGGPENGVLVDCFVLTAFGSLPVFGESPSISTILDYICIFRKTIRMERPPFFYTLFQVPQLT